MLTRAFMCLPDCMTHARIHHHLIFICTVFRFFCAIFFNQFLGPQCIATNQVAEDV